MKAKQLIGLKFGYLTVVERCGSQNNHALWLCSCKCGNEVKATTGDLIQGKTTSCGCRKKEISKSKFINEIGNKYGELTVIEKAENINKRTAWLCECSCGNTVIVTGKYLRKSKHPSCGCFAKKETSERSLHDLTGMKFGKLTVLSRAKTKYSKAGNQSTMWNCLCDCGNSIVVSAGALTTLNHTRSCGCMKTSFYEEKIKTFLDINKISHCREYSFSDLLSPNGYKLRFDFAFMSNDNKLLALLEMQGEQHYINNENNKFGVFQRTITDELKKDYCNKNNIPLYEIKYNEQIEEKLKKIINIIYANSVPSFN